MYGCTVYTKQYTCIKPATLRRVGGGEVEIGHLMVMYVDSGKYINLISRGEEKGGGYGTRSLENG